MTPEKVKRWRCEEKSDVSRVQMEMDLTERRRRKGCLPAGKASSSCITLPLAAVAMGSSREGGGGSPKQEGLGGTGGNSEQQ